MTNKLLTSVAAGAVFLGAALAPAAYAQDTTQPAAGQTMEQQPGMTGDAATGTTPGDTAATPGTTSTDTAQTPATGTDTQDTAQAPASGGDYLTAQAPDQISANTYIGQAVYNSGDESIGNISDLILKKDGGIAAAVVGVGGFLGIGEKWVAVPFEKISITQAPESNDVKLTTTETAESLQAAPEFKTTAQQTAERQSDTPVDSSTTSSTTTTGTAPATAE